MAYRLLKLSEEKATKAMLDVAATSIKNSIVLAFQHKNKPLKKHIPRQVVMAILLKVFKAQRENITSGNNALCLLIIIRRQLILSLLYHLFDSNWTCRPMFYYLLGNIYYYLIIRSYFYYLLLKICYYLISHHFIENFFVFISSIAVKVLKFP